ncbi:hypothetical protein BCR33DRAFT_398164 [Rhizoclosmatium globosum]|uniref:Uncharacterized protein n=1 Tax=Rhizoclosmatium globosum TaxID=329046 RepID=A0A1Y2CYC7_9FUNG|nr:hypothetical protein BCR33DRAFT_398164 [Rhizoclosmatium globosum]|eukprot:ORY51854.1 hypothetical protein BCR33DRAFT_398164 [Rhizoclosmatium globosum]
MMDARYSSSSEVTSIKRHETEICDAPEQFYGIWVFVDELANKSYTIFPVIFEHIKTVLISEFITLALFKPFHKRQQLLEDLLHTIQDLIHLSCDTGLLIPLLQGLMNVRIHAPSTTSDELMYNSFFDLLLETPPTSETVECKPSPFTITPLTQQIALYNIYRNP